MNRSTRIFVVLVLGLMILGVDAPARAEQAPSPLNLNTLIDEALSRNPDVSAAKNRWEALKERPPQARALDDPMLGFAVQNLPTETFSFRREDMTSKEFSLTQRVPFPGKRPLRSEIAEREAEGAFRDFQESKNRVTRDVKTAYYELFYVNRAIEITERSREILKLLNQIAETKYSVGEGIHTDVFKAQVELSKTLDELIVLRENKRSAQARLNTLIFQPAFAPLDEPGESPFRKFSADPEDLVKAAVENRPLIQSTKLALERNRAGLRLAQKDYYPDFEFRVAYGQRDSGPFGPRSDLISAGVAFNLPVWFTAKQKRKIAEARKEIESTKDQLEAAANEVRFIVSDKITAIHKAEKQMELLKTGIIPQAALSLDSAMSSYRVNRVNFITVLDSLMTLFRYETQYYRLLVDHQKGIAEIEAAVGKPITEGQTG
jgi:outer membrane protein, heavy metal efflux system